MCLHLTGINELKQFNPCNILQTNIAQGISSSYTIVRKEAKSASEHFLKCQSFNLHVYMFLLHPKSFTPKSLQIPTQCNPQTHVYVYLLHPSNDQLKHLARIKSTLTLGLIHKKLNYNFKNSETTIVFWFFFGCNDIPQKDLESSISGTSNVIFQETIPLIKRIENNTKQFIEGPKMASKLRRIQHGTRNFTFRQIILPPLQNCIYTQQRLL